MKLFIPIVLILGVLVVACAPQQEAPPAPVAEPETQVEAEPEAAPETEPEEPEIADETGFVPPSSGTVQMLGKEGFDPLELTISAGDTVEFTNTLEKADTLVFKQEGVVAMQNTPRIDAGATYSKTFDEAGVYEFWSVGYGPVGAKITVE